MPIVALFYFYVFVHGENKLKQSALFIALLPLLFTPVIHAETTSTSVLDNRAAQGDITQPGGARRLSEDQTAAIRASLNDKPAKNIILLIGDGMGIPKLPLREIMPKARWLLQRY
jgi:alkaline phosphatase